LIQNNLAALGYGAVTCVNLFSFRCQKLDLSKDVDISQLTNSDNENQIVQAVRDSDICIIAIGSLAKSYKRAAVYQARLFALLREQGLQHKAHAITAPCGTQGLHPLSGKLRVTGSWTLEPFPLPSLPQDEKNNAEVHTDTNKSAVSGSGKKRGKNER